ncbi:MAG TPA: GDSL family lipase [Lentisphaeria bacterium]|nr:MAG: hypothetical protein A2X48_20950 [Lentisphaerae bacterium GWF2_49_21]HBC88688.1 GDSL family lipase [Lentisphaeria bacterium]
MNNVNLTEEYFEGAVSFEKAEGHIKPWRLPFRELALFPSNNNSLVGCAEMPAGVRIRFATAAPEVKLSFLPVPKTADPLRLDCVIDNDLIDTVALCEGQEEIAFKGLPGKDKTVEIWLSPLMGLSLKSLHTGSRIFLSPDMRKKWTTYGSSITHCRGAHSPAQTWPAIAARAGNLNLTCLGFGGQCHMDPMVARLIRDLPADFISLKLGINIQGGATMSARTFKPMVIGMVKIIREKHPDVPIAIVSPIISPPRETKPNNAGMSLSFMREELQDAVKRLKECGDANIHYFNGLDLLGEADVSSCLQPDLVHPHGDGYRTIGERFARIILPKIKI